MIDQSQLLQHIKSNPGQSKAELDQNFDLSAFELARMLGQLMDSGQVYRYRSGGTQVYRVSSAGLYPDGGAA